MTPFSQQDVEISRVTNLVRGFGWNVTNQAVDGDKVTLTIQKTITGGLPQVAGGAPSGPPGP